MDITVRRGEVEDALFLTSISFGAKRHWNYSDEYLQNWHDQLTITENYIRDNIVFPRQGMYYNDSDMGRAMYDISNYSLDGKNEHDDSIDCCAMLCSLDKKVRKNKIEALKFRI